MLSVIRYTLARSALSQVWAPPWLAFILIAVILYPPNSPAIGSLALGAILLLPISVWICLGSIDSESEPQRSTMAAANGGLLRYRIGVLISCLLAGLALAPVSVVVAIIRNAGPLSAVGFIATILADVVAVLLGTAIGASIARPIINRAGFSWLTAVAVVVFLIAVPHLPPLRLMVELLEGTRFSDRDLLVCVAITLATVVGTAAIWWVTSARARR